MVKVCQLQNLTVEHKGDYKEDTAFAAHLSVPRSEVGIRHIDISEIAWNFDLGMRSLSKHSS
jgi:hypothetical protein